MISDAALCKLGAVNKFTSMVGRGTPLEMLSNILLEKIVPVVGFRSNCDSSRLAQLCPAVCAPWPRLGLPEDLEAKELWLRHLPESRVLPFGKKDRQ